MDAYIIDCLNLIVRWLHVITGVAWIGASFYFVWLDNNLEKPPEWKQKKGIGGDLWAIHGGGFYEVAKYKLAPEKMPETLHWFKWEAYSTWITGMLLLSIMFYLGADTYLIDRSKADIGQGTAILIGLSSLIGSFLLYEILCRTKLKEYGLAFGLICLAYITAMAYGLSQVFSDRGAYMHVGALIGTVMAGNVFNGIMPAQRALVDAVTKGTAPNASHGLNAKLRSTHNNYATLPLLFIMISNHYPMTYGHQYGWAILAAICAITAYARHYFNLKHQGISKPSILVISGALFIALLIAIAPPRPAPVAKDANQVSFSQVNTIIADRCTACHSDHTTLFPTAQGGVKLDTPDLIKKWAPRIQARAINSHDMPLGNMTKMTDEERATVGLWIQQGAKLD
ncbi:putative membrane protein [Sinobacterium caligoides]|uniref:Putative membrane protein n=1 Tax=Sinobacterium caligoides TaxID=933926 RepID=A0A3N2E0K7_9GAMM|nr:urate hydroxylase PuuD [Sinobacterium caligoides]ROS05643.1 putative membrane protein [Sinobacterium caligoides]